MLDTASRFLPAASNFMRQIAPSVVATLIAAGLIAGYNSAFHGHLVQPRMGMMKTEPAADPAPSQTTTVAMTKQPAKPVTEVITIHEYVTEPERIFDKPDGREAGKDQTKLKVADAPPAQAPAPIAQPAPVPAAVPPRATALPKPAPRTGEPPRQETRVGEPRVVSAAPMAPVVVHAPPPVIMAAPPAQPPVAYEPQPVVTGKPVVTVPDRQRPAYEPQRPYEARAPYEPQQAEIDAPPPPKPASGPLGIIANTLSPAAWFARAREFGERIERAGNDILPDIRQPPPQQYQ